MDFFDLVKTNRSYRGYDGNFKMTIQQLEHLVECARFCPSTVNMQPLKYFLSCDGDKWNHTRQCHVCGQAQRYYEASA